MVRADREILSVVENVINMRSIYIADAAGALLLVILLIAKGWELPGRKSEGRILLLLIIATLINCLIDPLIFLADGKPGLVSRNIIIIGNSILFLYNLEVGTGVLALVVKHINKKISRAQYVTVWIISGLEAALLIVNLYYPLVFSVDENNVYSRGPLYFIYLLAAFYLLAYGLVVYVTARTKDGSLRYFPVWEFIMPIALGVTVQTLFYGVSVQPVCFAMSFCNIVICLQKEYLYIDKLTGVYNRYELDQIIRYYRKRREKKFCAIMLDMNGFKLINDNYSHISGDEALKAMANILTNIIGNDGNVIRFAGDEFVLVIDKCEENTVSEYTTKIREAIDEYNRTSGKPYQISASMGGANFDVAENVDVIGVIDKFMYEDKVEYYRTHDRRSVAG